MDSENVSSSQNTQAQIIENQQTRSPRLQAWSRFFARNIDLILFGVIFGLINRIFFPYFIVESEILYGMLIIFVWLFFEAILLSTIGTTFGKWLLRINIQHDKSKILTFPLALKRSFLVWLKGMGIGFPFINLFTLISAYSDLTKRGSTSWDKDCQTEITYQKIGFLRTAVVIIIIVLYAGLIFLSKYNTPN